MLYKNTHFVSLSFTHTNPKLCLSRCWPLALVGGAQTETARTSDTAVSSSAIWGRARPPPRSGNALDAPAPARGDAFNALPSRPEVSLTTRLHLTSGLHPGAQQGLQTLTSPDQKSLSTELLAFLFSPDVRNKK